MKCETCVSGSYCSGKCRDSHVSTDEHQLLCISIQQLEEIQMNKRLAALPIREKNQVSLKRKLVSLVGEKPIVNCIIGGKKSEALWDTGAMVSVVNTDWLAEKYPSAEIQSIQQFLEGDSLHLVTANNSPISIRGVVVLDVDIGGFLFPVPFVVSGDSLSHPIIGFNVIKHLIFEGGERSSQSLQLACPGIKEKNIAAVVNLIKNENLKEAFVTTTKNNVLPPNSRCSIKCKTNYRASEPEESVMFSPNALDSEVEMEEIVTKVKLGRTHTHVVVTNPTNSHVLIDKGTVLGSIEAVSAVIPLMPKEVGLVSAEVDAGEEKETRGGPQGYEGRLTDGQWLPPVDLSHLPADKKALVEKVLIDEAEVFCREGVLQGDVPDMEMEIHLTDEVPVVIPHRQIPRSFYEEVKDFINDMIVNEWIRESKSPYSSPIVCARKPDHTLRMCIDYRALNKKIIPDKMPIPRITEIFDSLSGQEWFSTLDMAKAYHQGYVKEEHRKFTAFSTPWGLYEWIRIPMGISNAPPVFQRYVNNALRGLLDRVCAAYLDDILVYGTSFEDHVKNLKLVLQRLKTKGIRLSPSKCHLFKQEVHYLGRLVSKNGHRPDPDDTEALEKLREPLEILGS